MQLDCRFVEHEGSPLVALFVLTCALVLRRPGLAVFLFAVLF